MGDGLDLRKFLKKEGRALPVFLLVDVSGSMYGEKIGAVNVALKEMINSFRNIENPKGVIELCIITFGNDEIRVIKDLSKIDETDVYTLDAYGNTPLGSLLDRVSSMVEDYELIPSTAYRPTLVLISDGNPTDYDASNKSLSEIKQWEPMKKLHAGPRTSKTIKLAMGIGDDMNTDILKAFINDEEIPIIMAKDNDTISRFFKWVTMSVSVRSVSANPNSNTCVDTDNYFDKDETRF